MNFERFRAHHSRRKYRVVMEPNHDDGARSPTRISPDRPEVDSPRDPT